MGRLDGKVAVITGSTRGFGLAVARAYVREGARVVVSSRSSDAVSRAVAELGRDAAEGAVADVGEGWAAGALRDAALARFGRLDVWINNTALSGVYGPTALVPVDDTLAVLDTNIRGTYRGSVVAVRHFLAHGGGKLHQRAWARLRQAGSQPERLRLLQGVVQRLHPGPGQGDAR